MMLSTGVTYSQNLLLVLSYSLNGFWAIDVGQLIVVALLTLFPLLLWYRSRDDHYEIIA